MGVLFQKQRAELSADFAVGSRQIGLAMDPLKCASNASPRNFRGASAGLPKQYSVTSKRQCGYSLVEIVISMFILAIFVLSFTKALTYTKYVAEDNLYEGTSLTVAVSTIEQMKGASLAVIENPPLVDDKEVFTIVIEDGASLDLNLDEANEISVPLVTEEGGFTSKRLDMVITPSIERMASADGYWLTVRYSYRHPRFGRVIESVVRNARSTVPYG